MFFYFLIAQHIHADHPCDVIVTLPLQAAQTLVLYEEYAEYSCAPGYLLVGSSTRKCTGLNGLDGTEPTCSLIYCPTLSTTSPLSVSVSAQTYILDGVATYTCAAGYILSGSITRSCQTDGTWSGSAPTCIVVTCPSLTATSPHSVTVSDYTYIANGVATYSCAIGHSMTGSNTRTCQADGTWSGSEPICSIVMCPPLSSTSPLTVVASFITYNSVATYTCVTGYTMSGSNTRTCQADGSWSGSEPTCSMVTCPPLSATSPLTVNALIITYNSDVTYSCETGYTMSGSNTRTCQADGSWSGSKPTCSMVTCPPLSATSPLTVNELIITYNSDVTYSCETGYTMSGADTRTCQADGSWSGSEPACSMVTCPSLSAVIPLVVSTPTLSYNSDATYTCVTGYTMSGSNTRACQADGTWTGAAPTCLIVSCPLLTDAGPLSVSAPIFTYSSVATYSCIPGYLMSGSITRTCQADGTWSGSVPMCEIITCSTLSATSPLTVSAAAVNIGDVITYSCEAGYEINGTNTRTCQTNGTWSGSVPTCEIITCPTLSATDPLNVSVTAVNIGDIATYSCATGFEINGTDTRTCQADGTWSGSAPKCEIITCLTLSATSPLNVSVSAVYIGDIATYSCEAGFEINGTITRTCEKDGTWSDLEPTCTPLACPNTTAPINGRVNFPSGFGVGGKAIFGCNPGYILSDNKTATCTVDGTWDRSRPSCLYSGKSFLFMPTLFGFVLPNLHTS